MKIKVILTHNKHKHYVRTAGQSYWYGRSEMYPDISFGFYLKFVHQLTCLAGGKRYRTNVGMLSIFG